MRIRSQAYELDYGIRKGGDTTDMSEPIKPSVVKPDQLDEVLIDFVSYCSLKVVLVGEYSFNITITVISVD